MRLVSIQLRNWKTYRRVDLLIPGGGPDRNVAIIEGHNGAGKTSLLEAIAFCLFGRAASSHTARVSKSGRSDQSYDGFLERALNVGARGSPARMSVALEFEDGERRIGVERAWHFSAGGRHRRDDEEARLLDGPDLDFVLVPPPPDMEPFVREFVATHLLAENLAGFFLLDGEHLERLSGGSVDDQIWGALDSVLGLPALRTLASDLRAYSRERRRGPAGGFDERANRAMEELATLEGDVRSMADRVDALTAGLLPLRGSRDAIVRRIGSLRGESYRTFKAVFEERERLVRERDGHREELRILLAGDVAMALAGPSLRRRSLDRLAADERAERWDASSAASLNRFDDFVAALRGRSGREHDLDELRAAWEETWSSRPDDCSGEILHSHLGEADRRAVTEHLGRLSSIRAETVAALSRTIADLDARIAACENEIGRQRGLDEDAQALADELTAAQRAIAEREAEHANALSALAAVKEEASAKRLQMEALIASGASAAPLMARATRAERFADLAERMVEAAVPANLGAVSAAVTAAYREMAHKTLVQEVVIAPGEPVRLLDDEGEDVRRVDASAGESQVFTLAVMSGLASLAKAFPIVMDTPLARLDPLHRRNVLTHFASGSRQLILLTHPAELGEAELEVLGTRLAGVVSIDRSLAGASGR